MSKAQNMSDLSRLVFAFDNHSMYNVWYENELVGWIMMAYTLLQNSSVSYSLIGRCKCCLNSIGRASAVSAGVCRSAASHCALRGDGRAKRSWFHRFEMKLLFKFIQSSKTTQYSKTFFVWCKRWVQNSLKIPQLVASCKSCSPTSKNACFFRSFR